MMRAPGIERGDKELKVGEMGREERGLGVGRAYCSLKSILFSPVLPPSLSFIELCLY